MGIRLKLTLLLTGLLVPLLGAGGLFNVAVLENNLIDEMRVRGLGLLSALSVPCSIALANHEIERLDDYLAQLSGKSSQDPQAKNGNGDDPLRDLVYLCVVDKDGRVLAHTRETAYGTVRRDDFTRRAITTNGPLFERIAPPGGVERLAVSLPVESGLRWGTLLAEFSLDRLHARITQLRRQTLGVTLLLILLALAALSIGLSRLVVRPVRALSKMAERLGAGELDQRIHVASRDEMGTLASAFNATASELESYTKDLQEKVRQRSREIVDKNEQLERANQRLSEANKRLEEVATTDGLTGLANKTHWLGRLEFELLRARRGGHRLSMLMLDVDNFKHYNDTNGHMAGDRLLEGLARILTDSLRATDIPGRFGGEEFGIALLDSGLRAGRRVAEKIRRAVERADFEGQEKQPGGNLTVSIGVAELEDEQHSVTDLIEKADAALYRAKEGGRNRVES